MRGWMSSLGARGGEAPVAADSGGTAGAGSCGVVPGVCAEAEAVVVATGIAGVGAAVLGDAPGSGMAVEAGGLLTALEDVSLAR